MSAIFISHSSRDNAASAEIRRRLQDQGHRSIFLDFDPADGIPAGRSWEQELYAQLRACQAILVLCSEHSMASDWCFAEITHAKSLGKHVFPIKIGPCEIRPLLNEFQILDWTVDREDTYRRLWRGLEIAGLDPKNAFDWDGSRPPYPGLLAFQAEDAAIFFGRDEEIRGALALLRRLERFGGARWTLVLGASGSGKSSLIRAGILPRLERDRESWLALAPFRPLDRPFTELAKALAEAFAARGEESAPRRQPSAADIERRLYPSTRRPNSQALVELAHELRQAAGQPRAAVLLPIDQLEELLVLAPETAEESSRFLAFLREAAAVHDSPLRILATLRSDFLGDFQGHAELRELTFESVNVGPMSVNGYARVIEGPAELAGIELESGLVQAMVDDTETEDALPLLAFALRELWEGYGEDGRLDVTEYRDHLGGLSGAVALAAEAALVGGSSDLSDKEEADLRSAFVAMVRLDDEGKYARRTVLWSEMPTSARGVLERFVDARLLVARGDGRTSQLEVAHEALLRSWERLVAWLAEDRVFLMWRKRLEEERREWERTERHGQALLRGPALAEALGWSERRRDLLSQEELAFIGHSLSAHRNRKRRRSAAVGLVLLITAGIAGWSHLQRRTTEKIMLVAHDRNVLSHSRGLRKRSPRLASRALLGLHNPDLYLESLHLDTLAAEGRLLGRSDDSLLIAIDASERPASTTNPDTFLAPLEVPHAEAVGEAADKAAGEATTEEAARPSSEPPSPESHDVDIKLMFDERWSVRLPHDAQVYRAAIEGSLGIGLFADFLSRRGRKVLTASDDLRVRLWELPEVETLIAAARDAKLPTPEFMAQSKEPTLLTVFDGHPKRVTAIEISHDGAYAATACEDEIGIWRTELGTEPVLLAGHRGVVTAVSFDPKSRLLLTTSRDGTARIWKLSDLFAAPIVLEGHDNPLISGTFNLDSSHALTLSDNRAIWHWTVATGQGAKIAEANCDAIEVGFAELNNSAIIACADGSARIFDLVSGEIHVLD
ncbi:MAG: TIR domain-containing protein [Acidobacteriota bacterium]